MKKKILRGLSLFTYWFFAVIVHHVWFGIDKRNSLQSGFDGVFLAVFVMGMAWLSKKLLKDKKA